DGEVQLVEWMALEAGKAKMTEHVQVAEFVVLVLVKLAGSGNALEEAFVDVVKAPPPSSSSTGNSTNDWIGDGRGDKSACLMLRSTAGGARGTGGSALEMESPGK
ncbi:hypothetical protein DXG03_007363, partial [Asterophora parasitica]